MGEKKWLSRKSWEEKLVQGHNRAAVDVDEWTMRILPAVTAARPTAMVYTLSSGS